MQREQVLVVPCMETQPQFLRKTRVDPGPSSSLEWRPLPVVASFWPNSMTLNTYLILCAKDLEIDVLFSSYRGVWFQIKATADEALNSFWGNTDCHPLSRGQVCQNDGDGPHWCLRVFTGLLSVSLPSSVST